MKGKIRVYCRVRPRLSSEPESQDTVNPITIPDTYTINVNASRTGSREFTFDRVFNPQDSQAAVYSDVDVSGPLSQGFLYQI